MEELSNQELGFALIADFVAAIRRRNGAISKKKSQAMTYRRIPGSFPS